MPPSSETTSDTPTTDEAMSDKALLFKLQQRHSEIFWRVCRGRGNRYDDAELEILERRIRETKERMMVGT